MTTKQIIPGNGAYDALPNFNGTEYNTIYGGYTWSGTESGRVQLVAAPGTISRLRVKLSAAPGVDNTFTFTVRTGSGAGAIADTALTVTIANPDTTGDDLAHSFSVAADDTLSISCTAVEGGTIGSVYASWCVTFTPTTDNEFLLLSGSGDALSNSATEYSAVVASTRTWNVNSYPSAVVIPCDGTIKDLYVRLSADPGTDPDAFTFTLMRSVGDGDSMAATTLTTSIVADNVSGSDTTHDVTVAAGDVVVLRSEPISAPSETPYAYWGMVFVPDTAGEFPIMGGSYDTTATGVTEVISPVTTMHTFQASANEVGVSCLVEDCVIRKLRVWLSTDVAAGEIEVKIREDANDVLSCTITSGDVGSDVVSYLELGAGVHRLSLIYISDASLTSTTLHWGFVGNCDYVTDPTVQSGSICDLMLALVRTGAIS